MLRLRICRCPVRDYAVTAHGVYSSLCSGIRGSQGVIMFPSRHKANFMLDTLTYLVVAAVLLFALFPVVWTFLTSIKLEKDIITRDLQYIPHEVTFDNYIAIWN